MDLRDALNVLKRLKDRGDKDTKIGFVIKPIASMAGDCPVGTVVMFKKETKFGDLTVELPMTRYEIVRNTASGSGNITKSSMVGIPPEYIEEIILE